MHHETARVLNILGLWGLSAILAVAFTYQFLFWELPCPLCLLQRAAFVAAGVGIVLNITTGLRPSHYGMIIVSAIIGAAISGRQILRHIVPGSGAYGSALFGLHFYSWAFIAFAVVIVAGAVMLLFDRQFRSEGEPRPVAALGRDWRPVGVWRRGAPECRVDTRIMWDRLVPR